VIVAGVDVGNATTEVAIVAGGAVLGVDRVPTRGRKGSPESLRAAAALVGRLEHRLGCRVDEARIAPLRGVETTTLTIPHVPPPAGRLTVLAAGVGTPGGAGAFAGAPLWLDRPAPPGPPVPAVAVVPAAMGYEDAAKRLGALLSKGTPVGGVLVEGDEGVLIANRSPAGLPVIDQVDVAAVAACDLLAVEVRRPGQPLTLLADPVALAAALALGEREAADAATVSRALLDCSNAVVGRAAPGSPLAAPARPGAAAAGTAAEPWLLARGERVPLRTVLGQVAGWPVGTVRAVGTRQGVGPARTAGHGRACGDSGTADDGTAVDDLFALDLAAVAESATARQHLLGRSALVASLHRLPPGTDHAALLAGLLERPVHRALTEPAAARRGALTTPGARDDAVVVDLGAGTIDVITPGREVVAAGAGDLLTAAVAETLGITRAAADWVKRGPCLRVDGGQRYEAEDGSRGFLDRPPPASAAGMLAVSGPAGLLPFDRRHSPAEWRALRLRLKQAVFAANLRRALGELATGLPQVLIVGGPAGDDELLGVLLRSFPAGVMAGRASVAGTLAGPGAAAAGHRYAAALGLALPAPPPDLVFPA
jgi:diol dehydratase reactivase ATPase-like protein/cobalamin-dependent diol dehydratase reactivating factor